MTLNAVTCPACGVEEPFDDDGNEPPPLHEVGLFRCNACDARVVYGKIMPRIVVEPYTDERGFTWLRRRFQDPVTGSDLHVIDVDPRLAAIEARSVLAMVIQ